MDNTKYLAVDYGDKRVGIAVSDREKKYSFSRGYLENNKDLLKNLLKLVKEENIEKIILGHPLNLNSEKTIQTLKVEEFSNKLRGFLTGNSFEAEIIFFDERFTSSIAQHHIISSGLKKSKRQEKGLVDSISAQIILQDYIDKVNRGGT